MDKKVHVWDLPTRLFHWALAALFIFMIVTGDQGDDWLLWHMRAGYALLGLLTFRVIWGLAGSHYARFQQFIASPVHAWTYTVSLIKGNARHYLGHNPAGGWMVVTLLVGLFVQAVSGLFITDDILWEGPFYNAVTEGVADLASTIHHQLQSILQALVILHILGVIWHRVRYKDPLVGAMIHGKKPTITNDTAVTVRVHPAALIIAVVCATALVVWLWQKPI